MTSRFRHKDFPKRLFSLFSGPLGFLCSSENPLNFRVFIPEIAVSVVLTIRGQQETKKRMAPSGQGVRQINTTPPQQVSRFPHRRTPYIIGNGTPAVWRCPVTLLALRWLPSLPTMAPAIASGPVRELQQLEPK